MDTLSFIAAMTTALGGYEFLRYMLDRRSNRRIAAAKAGQEEFHALREYNEFLQTQLSRSAESNAERTAMVRTLNADILRLTREKNTLEVELALKRCEILNCPKRQPPHSTNETETAMSNN